VSSPMRGHVYRVDAGHGPEPWVVVSNNVRNRQLHDVLAARITTTAKPELPTIVRLEPADPVAGVVLADEIEPLLRDELDTSLGPLSQGTIMKLNRALRITLALP
jgi:mRNA interferase MazF